MLSTEVAGSWDALVTRSQGSGPHAEDIFYLRQDLYDLPWHGVDLGSQLWAIAPNAGPIAMIRDSRQFVEITSGPITPTLQIYNGAGALFSSMPWHAMDSVAALAWTPDDHLMVIDARGRISLRGWDCKELKDGSFSLPLESNADIVLARTAGPSLAVATRAGTILVVPNVREPAPEVLATLDPSSEIFDMAVIAAADSGSGALEVLVATRTQLVRLDASGRSITPLPSTPSALSVAPNGQLVAVLSDSADDRLAGVVRVYTMADVAAECVAEVQLPATSPGEEAVDLAWCGSDAVAILSSSSRLSIASPFGDLLHYELDDQALLCTEVDGLRVLTRRRHSFIARVPQCSIDTFQIGSVEPPARLLDARIKFDDQNPDCDRILRNLGASTAAAVHALADAALHEWNIGLQRSLLQAAALGAAQQPQGAKGRIGEVSRRLRALNTARKASFCMGLTARQLSALTPRGLVLRMCEQRQHPAAYQLAKELQLHCAEVLEHWALHRIVSAPPTEGDAALLATLQDRLSMEPSVSYSALASQAAKTGRRMLAAQLLELEPSASRVVPLLLDLGVSFARALDKAILSNDPDLVYLCIFHALREEAEHAGLPTDRDRARLEALRAISARPLARALFVAYCTQAGLADLANEIEAPQDKLQSLVTSVAQSAARRPRDPVSLPTVELAVRSFKAIGGADGAPFDRYLAEWPRLMIRQAIIERDTTLRGLQGLPLAATLRQLIIAGHPKVAQDVAREFGVSERRLLKVQIDALIACRNWDHLLDFVGKKPAASSGLVEASTSAEQLLPSLKGTDVPAHLTRHVIRRLPDQAKRIAAYREWGMEHEAALEEAGMGVGVMPQESASAASSVTRSAGGWLASWRSGGVK